MHGKVWTVEIEEDPETGELILPIPKELLFLQGWQDGDELKFIDNQDGSWTMTDVKEPKKFDYEVKVKYHDEVNDSVYWNETCAMVVETFGLPGDRYMYRPRADYMVFEFESKHDALLCQLLLSDRL